MENNRFQDEKKRLTDFNKDVWVECPLCQKKAIAKFEGAEKVKLVCLSCSYHKEESTEVTVSGMKAHLYTDAHLYFDANLWFMTSFKNDVFWAYNLEHLEYLERYISAGLREHKNREHFTLLEKLPKFYHEAKNRDSLLKTIEKLKKK